MATFKEINTASDAIIDAIFTAYADGVDEDGDAVIFASDTLDDVLEIMNILARMDSRRYKDTKRESESIL
jgi:hypothetical protein